MNVTLLIVVAAGSLLFAYTHLADVDAWARR